MKNYFLFSLVTASLMGSAAMAMVDQEEELLQKLDSKAAKVALQAINNEYYVNWEEFDFKDTEDDKSATNLKDYLNDLLRTKYMKWCSKGADFRRTNPKTYSEDPNYVRYDSKYRQYYDKQDQVMASWSHGFSGILSPEDQVSSASSSTSLETLLEQLDEKETKAVLWAITHKFALTDPAYRASDSKVNQYLRAVLERKQQAHPDKKYSAQRTNLGEFDS